MRAVVAITAAATVVVILLLQIRIMFPAVDLQGVSTYLDLEKESILQKLDYKIDEINEKVNQLVELANDEIEADQTKPYLRQQRKQPEEIDQKGSDSSESLRCRIGTAPWSHLTQAEWNDYLKEFNNIYVRRLDERNDGGGGFFHYFGLFIVIRTIQPTAIVESGAWNGMGTWFLRQIAGPTVKIVVISPQTPTKYKDPQALYLTGSKFIDFSKTTVEQWKNWVPDIERTLLFMDDHQAAVRRLQEARALGFQHLFFDDNYPPAVGDNFSAKQICSGMNLWNFLGQEHATWKDNFSQVSRKLSPTEYKELEQRFHENTAVYAEFPPTWKGPSRFEILNEEKYEQISEPPLFTKEQLAALGVEERQTAGFDAEAAKYTFALYVQAKPLS